MIESISAMQKTAEDYRAHGWTIGFVSTMGSLHEGKLSLVDRAKEHADRVILSLFVNPYQFGPSENPGKYPRQLEKDLEKCRERGVDAVFIPSPEEIYPSGYSTFIDEESLSAGLCGVSRPNLFRGKATVFVKFINIIRPDIAVLGQKGAQQATVIKRVLRDLHLPVEILLGPTVRDEEGLALGTFNDSFTEFQRKDALALYHSLSRAEEMVQSGMRNVDRINGEIIYLLGRHRRLRIIYVSIVHRETLEPVKEIIPGKTMIAVAAWCDEIRLIDNILL